MSEGVVTLVSQGLVLAFWLALPIAVAAALSGILSGLLQSFTAWQEPALAYVPRALAVAAAWILFGPVVARELVAFARLAWGGG